MPAILIVDDEPGMRMILSKILTREGYEVITAEDGREAKDLFEQKQPDVVILDIRLPGEDGFEVLSEMRRIDSNVTLILCSGFSEVDTTHQAMKMGAVGYLLKPFKNDDVIEKVRKAIQMRDLEKDELTLLRSREASLPEEGEHIPTGKPLLKKKTKIPSVVFPIMLQLLVIGTGLFYFLKVLPGKELKDKTYTTIYFHPTGLSMGKEYLWSSDWYTQAIYKHRLDDALSLAKAYHFPGLHPSGLAWGGDSLWSCDSWKREIYKHRLDENLTIEKTYSSPGSNPSGLFWDGTNLWSCDVDTAKIYKHRLDDKLTVVDVYDSPGKTPIGIFLDGKNLWSCDNTTNRIYVHNSDATYSPSSAYIPPHTGSDQKIAGLAWDGEYVWFTVDEAGKVHQVSKRILEDASHR